MIHLKNINIKYTEEILENGEIDIPSHQVTMIKGKSGIGKTSLLYRIALVSHDKNYDYYYNDHKINLDDEKECSEYRKNNFSFVLQEDNSLSHLTVEEMLYHYSNINQIPINTNEIQELIHLMKLDVDLKQNVMTLSLGERRRLSIACSIVKKPAVLILDEPTASLDEENELLIFKILKQLSENMTILFSSHSEYADCFADVIYTVENKDIVKIKGVVNDSPCLMSKKQKINFSFVKKYIFTYFKHYKFVYTLMIMILLISMLSLNLGSILIYQTQENSRNKLEGQFENKLVVTNDVDSKYIDETYNSYISLNKENAYPLYQMKTELNGESIYIIPYFESDHFDKYLESSFKQDDNGVYMDNLTYYALKDKTITIEVEHSSYVYTFTPTINGVFKDSKQQHFSSNGNRFIYVPYEMMSSIYKMSQGTHQYVAYVLIYDSYDELVDDKLSLENEGYHVNDTFINIDAIESMVSYYNKTFFVVSFIIILITVLLDMILISHLYLRRRKEITVLKISGLNNTNILSVFLSELAMEMMVIAVTVIIIDIVLMLFLRILNMNILIYIAFIDLIFVLLLFLERIIVSSLYISKIDMEYMLRHN